MEEGYVEVFVLSIDSIQSRGHALLRGNDISSRYSNTPTATDIAAMFIQLKSQISTKEATEAVTRYCRSLRMNAKVCESLVRFCKWDEGQLKIGLEIINKYESFQLKDTSSAKSLKRASSWKNGGKVSMTADLFYKFTKLSKAVLKEKSPAVLKGKYF